MAKRRGNVGALDEKARQAHAAPHSRKNTDGGMLGAHGRGAGGNAGAGACGPAATPAGEFDAMPFLLRAEDGTLVLHDEAVAFLQTIKEPLFITTLVGEKRTGKSLLQNLLSHHLTPGGGFVVGPNPGAGCTKGIWLRKGRQQLKYQGRPVVSLFLDCEGMFDQHVDNVTQSDNELYVLALLLSSQLFINTKGDFNRSLLENLTTAAHLCNEVHPPAADDAGLTRPNVGILCRDDMLGNPGRDDAYLREQLGRHRDIVDTFPGLSFVRMPLPLTKTSALCDCQECNERADRGERRLAMVRHLMRHVGSDNAASKLNPSFMTAVDDVRGVMAETLASRGPKQVSRNCFASGKTFAAYAAALAAGLPKGMPRLLSQWQSVVQAASYQAADDARGFYSSLMAEATSEPVGDDALNAAHEGAVEAAMERYYEQCKGDRGDELVTDIASTLRARLEVDKAAFATSNTAAANAARFQREADEAAAQMHQADERRVEAERAAERAAAEALEAARRTEEAANEAEAVREQLRAQQEAIQREQAAAAARARQAHDEQRRMAEEQRRMAEELARLRAEADAAERRARELAQRSMWEVFTDGVGGVVRDAGEAIRTAVARKLAELRLPLALR